ncbi:MAG TPA: zf-HC2 domain-containing protein, partial [Gemmatimonadaceae bacterium]|nr:zf-HC2 domain-containing protein [Gemmatimonadaceae bacterium]
MRERPPTADADDDRLWSDRHLTEGAIRAHLDGELGALRRIRARRHLRRCPRCAAARDEQLLISGRAGALLAGATPRVDVHEGWRRLMTLSAATPRASSSRR